MDVLVIGAGISGIGAGHYLTTRLPSKTFAIIEARSAAGGTWDLFRYPGIRSDSDLHTFGYEFKPWRDKQSIADAPRILSYLQETIEENGLAEHIRYNHRVVSASWSSQESLWTVQIDRADTGEHIAIKANWIFAGSGYYRYDEGYTPYFAGRERFSGQIIHPQHWPEDLDHTGKRVVVIGSGATAVTLLPAMAQTAEHVTMLQRTPSYIMPIPREDAIANTFRRILGDERGYKWARRKNIAQQRLVYTFCQRFPKTARRAIRAVNQKFLPAAVSPSTNTSIRRTTRGISDCARCPTAICSRPSARVRRRSSPIASPRSPRTAFCSRAGANSKRTSSSPRPVSTCSYSAAWN